MQKTAPWVVAATVVVVIVCVIKKLYFHFHFMQHQAQRAASDSHKHITRPRLKGIPNILLSLFSLSLLLKNEKQHKKIKISFSQHVISTHIWHDNVTHHQICVINVMLHLCVTTMLMIPDLPENRNQQKIIISGYSSLLMLNCICKLVKKKTQQTSILASASLLFIVTSCFPFLCYVTNLAIL